MHKIIENIRKHKHMRENVNELKKHIDEIDYLEYDVVMDILLDEDMKVRKNGYMILKNIEHDLTLSQLFDLYKQEASDIVRIEMLEVLKDYPFNLVSNFFKEVMNQLRADLKVENNKQKQEMVRLITDVFVTNGKVKIASVKELENEIDVVLTCYEVNKTGLYEHVVVEKKKIVPLGVLCRISSFEEINRLRDYDEMLFPISNFKNIPFKVQDILDTLKTSNMNVLIRKLFDQGMVLFRVDSEHVNGKYLKNEFVNKLSLGIQSLNPKLINNASNYVLTFVLYENKGNCKVYLKVNALEDNRFNYRMHSNSTSMKPILASSIMHVLRPYLIEHATVVDLCCGTGTMLIERDKVRKTQFLLGVDIYALGLEMAKTNCEKARVNANFINRDFRDFSHHHLFDEVFGDLPVVSSKQTKGMIEKLYNSFLKRASTLTKSHGYIFVYTTEVEILKSCFKNFYNAFEVVDQYYFDLSNTKGGLFVLQRY